MVSVFLKKAADANWNGPAGTKVGGGSSVEDGEMKDEEGPSDDEGGRSRKGHNLVGSCFEDPDDDTCDVTGYGEDDDGARIPFISYMIARRLMLMVLPRRCVLGFWHMTRGSTGTINVPAPYSNII